MSVIYLQFKSEFEARPGAKVHLSDIARVSPSDDEIAALERAGIAARHEARLCPGCRIDFLCGHVGIEVKKNRPPRASLMKQIARYAASPDISALILVAPGDLRLPREVCGVSVECVALARLWGVALP